MSLSSEAIKKKIQARESFWVGSENERKAAINIAKILGLKYTTGSDDRGGFYVLNVPKLKKEVT
jgi:hypothetical protein